MHELEVKLPCEQFLPKIEISRTFLRAKQVGEKRGRFQFIVEITHKAVVLILISLYIAWIKDSIINQNKDMF